MLWKNGCSIVEQLCPVTGSKGTDEFRADPKVTEISLGGKPFINTPQDKMDESGPDGRAGPLKVLRRSSNE